MALFEWQKGRVTWSRPRFFFDKGDNITNRSISSSLPMQSRLMWQIARDAIHVACRGLANERMIEMSDDADAGCGPRNRATTESSEDYLEAILRIRSERGSCRNVDIAERLGVSKASVTKALGNLARGGLAEVVGRDVRLTDEGGRLAEATLAKHRFFERLLAESGVDAETASAEACRMEHCLSEESFRKLADRLGRGR